MKKLSFHVVEKERPDKPVLIIDPQNFLGRHVYEKIKGDFFTVFVTTSNPTSLINNEKNILVIPYKKIFPQIPDLSYEHIFIFYNGEKELKELSAQFIEQAEKYKNKIYFIIKKEDVDDFPKIVNSYKKAHVFAVGDIFGDEAYSSYSTISKYFLSVLNFNQIIVEGSGLKKTQPVFLEDVLISIIENVFTEKKQSQFFFIFPKHPPTEISLAHTFQKINPLIKVDFTSIDSRQEEDEIFTEGEYLLPERYFLEKRIKEELERLMSDKNIKSGSIKESEKFIEDKNKKYIYKKNQPLKPLRFIFALSIFFTILPAIMTLLFFSLGAFNLRLAKSEIEKTNFTAVKEKSSLAKYFFFLSSLSSTVLKQELEIVGKKDLSEVIYKTIEEGEDVSNFIYSVSDAVLAFSKSDFLNTTASLRNVILGFQKIKTTNKYYFGKQLEFKSSGIEKITQLVSSSLNYFPSIIGINQERTYLVIFQNNMELRPGGGFIGSYGILKLKRGKVLDFTIHDVYDADGQLKGHVEPPYPIRRYLPSVHWYLRDGNFSPNFTEVASASAFFLRQETKQDVDGVIGVDVSFIRNLLKATGPVYVPEYKETVDFDNFYILTQTHAEKDFFPGSTQKKDFLRALFRALNNRLSGNKNLSYLKLIELFGDSILEKHLLFAFKDESIQKIFNLEKASSSLADERPEKRNVINDFLGISEANLGVNKVNYYIYRDLKTNIKINEEGEVLGETTIKYFNDSVEGRWPGGIYKNYLRIILPQASELLSILIDGVEQDIVEATTDPIIYEAKNFSPSKGLEVEKKDEAGKTTYGFLVNVLTKSQKSITFVYKLSKNGETGKKDFTYNFRFFKQPGVDHYPFSLNIFYPEGFRVIEKSNELSLMNEKVVFSNKLFKDTDFYISFSEK